MISLPEWDSDSVVRSRRRTRRMYLYDAARMFSLLVIPWGLAAVFPVDGSPVFSFHMILAFFCTVTGLFAVEAGITAIRKRRRRWLLYRLFSTLPELLLLCAGTMLWWLRLPVHVALAIGIWWAIGVFLVLSRYAARRWAMKEATLVTKDYRLFGRQVGRALKRAKHDKASLFELPMDSAFNRRTIMALVGHEPEIYVGAEAKRVLDPDELRVCMAHELGHAWAGQYVGYELADWVRRLLFVPVFAAAASTVLMRTAATEHAYGVFIFLTCTVFVWQINAWAACLLGRPRELAADVYAVEMTRTPTSFVNALVKLSTPELENVFPNVPDTLGFSSHPCLMRRIKHVKTALEASEEHTSTGGRRRRVR